MHIPRLVLAALTASFLLPASALAMTSKTYTFSEGSINARWEGKGSIAMQQQSDGILLSTTGTGIFVTNDALDFTPQIASLTVSSDTPTLLYFTWIYSDDAMQANHSYALNIPAGNNLTESFSLSDIRGWDSSQKRFGLILLPNSRVTIHDIRFDTLNFFERMFWRARSFWTFDTYRTYSINFLWGPHVSGNPVGQEHLFDILPPPSSSGTYLLLCMLTVLIAVLMKYGASGAERKRRALKIGGLMIIGAWILLDLRMGSEFLSYILHDQQSYIGASASDRTFRDRNRFYDFAAFASPLVADRSSYIFFAEQQWPYLGNMRYLTYPAIPGIDLKNDDTWVIYQRSDIAMNDASELTIDGQPFTEAGDVLGRFNDHSFMFRTRTAPSSPQ